METSDLQKSILDTIAYFHLFNFPLTGFEVYKYLWRASRKYDVREVDEALEELCQNKILGFNEGFYFLKGKPNFVEKRKARYLLAQEKMKIARPFLKILAVLPFIKAILVCNDVSYQNAPEKSDIDLAIICSENKIWTARFFSTLIMKLFRRRPTSETHKNKICLSFYLTENSLNLENATYENDIHFIYWLNQFLPVYGEEKLIDDFFTANDWTKKYLPNMIQNKSNALWTINRRGTIKKFFEFILSGLTGNFLEKFLKKIQWAILPKHLLELAHEQNTNVIINDQILKFHDKDNRLETKRRWNELVFCHHSCHPEVARKATR
jgi:hypothetical protein